MVYETGDHRIFVRTDERGRAVPSATELRQYFMQFGEVLDIYRPARTPDVAYITMNSGMDMQGALSDPKPDINGNPCFLQQALPRGAGAPGPGVPISPTPAYLTAVHTDPVTVGSSRIYVTGLADEVDSETLRVYFGYFGVVKDVYIPIDRLTGRKKLFAFITMSSTDEAAAILAMATHQLTDAHTVNVTLAEPRGDFRGDLGGAKGTSGVGSGSNGGTPSAQVQAYVAVPAAARAFVGQPAPSQVPVPMTVPATYPSIVRQPVPPTFVQTAPLLDDASNVHRLYVTNLTDDVDEEILRVYFTYFGPVNDVYIPVDRLSGARKPFAFVTMASAEGVQNVLQFPAHQLTDSVTVNVTLAESRPTLKAPGICSGGNGGAPGAPTESRSGAQQFSEAANAYGKSQSLKQGIPGNYRLFVFGMPHCLNADMLRGHFARFGEILDIYVPPRTPDVAYITFTEEQELQDAVLNSGTRIAGFSVQGVKEALPKECKGGGKAKGRSEPY